MDPFAAAALRRVPGLGVPEPTPPGDPALVRKIAREIHDVGPMTFARFMALALYDPDGGYYTADRARPGREGDFLTAPEAHPIFGWSLARQVAQTWWLLDRPADFVLREHGAGNGALAAAILDGLRREAPETWAATRYQPIEVTPQRIAVLAERLAGAGHGDRLDLGGAAAGEPVTGMLLGNEVLDALPVHRVRGLADGAIEELFVGLATAPGRPADIDPAGDAPSSPTAARSDPAVIAFEAVPGPPSTPALAARLAEEGVHLRAGQEAEICLELDRWIADRAHELARGLLLLIDYGHPADELYDGSRRPRGTLLAYRRHRAVDEPFAAVGRQDLTAHVDVTAVARAAEAAGLTVLGVTTQMEALQGLGAGELFAALGGDPATAPEDYLLARAALLRMVDPAAMGKFRVLCLGRGLPPDAALRVLDFHLAQRRRTGRPAAG